MAKVLIIEDDKALAELVKQTLVFAHYSVEVANDGTDGYEKLQFYKYDAIILDVDLPGMKGTEVCRAFRAKGGATPILMLTGKDSIDDKERGLDIGADDYLTKPFNMREFEARLRALLRRASTTTASNTLQIADLELDPQRYSVTRSGAEVYLSRTDFALLEFLMRHPGEVFSPEALLDRVWLSDSDSTVEAIRSSLKRIRKKVDVDPERSLIRTVHGVGYCLEAQRSGGEQKAPS